MFPLFNLSGKTAVLTGASKGMGLAMATALAEHGARVVISARNQDQLETATQTINSLCGKDMAIPIVANAGQRDALENLVETARSRAGSIDIVIGNAGVNPYFG
ncbi:MAG: SDR family NAD(P)-dependent oxidoreductase, partial [Paracoccaceae bacterium]